MLFARQAKLAYQIAFTFISSMVYFAPSAGAAPTIDENFSHVGVTPQTDITTSGNVTDIVGQKQNNVIGWRDFSVGNSETVRFDNGAHNKNYLNMVTGASTSAIYGTIQGGKDVYIVNPHGVIFGKGASVNVGNLYVSTQNVNPATVINAVNTANASGTDVVVADVLGSDYTNPTKKTVTTETVDGKAYTNAAVSHLADVVSLIDDGGSVVANKVVLVGGHVRFLNSDKVTASSVEAYYDQQDTAIDGYVHVGNAGGTNAGWVTNSGKSIDYYKLISTVADLKDVNSNRSGNYMMKNDIDLASISSWTPLGDSTTAFTGKFDGMMHEVQNLTITSAAATQGLFGVVDGTNGGRIDNVGVINPNLNVASGGPVAGLARNNANLRGAYVEGGSITGGVGTGGVVGELNGSTLDTAYSTASVGSDSRAGGLVGSLTGSGGSTVKNAYFTGMLTGTAQWGIYGRANPTQHHNVTNVYYTSGTSVGPQITNPPVSTAIGGSAVTTAIKSYQQSGKEWDISNVGGTNSIWRIYEGQSRPLLTAFMKGTIQADVSVKEYERAKNPDGSYIGAHASADPTFAAYTQEVTSKGTKALNGADINQVYDANVIKYVKNDGTAITSASDVDFLHKLTSDYGSDNSTIKLGDSGNDNTGVRNVAAMKSYIYSTQKGYDIVGGNVTITPRAISSASDPIKVADKIYDGIDTIAKADLQAALDNSVTQYTGILKDDEDAGMKLVATDTLATYTNTGYNADNTTKYTTTAAKDAGYNKIVNTTGAIQVQGTTTSTADNYSLNAADIVVTGTIKQREIYVDLNKATGIDKVYDATSAVRELTSAVTGGTSYIGGTEGVAPDENIKVDDSDAAHKILNNEASIDYANSTAKYYDGASKTANEVVNATDGTDDYTVKYDNITLTGAGKDNYKLVQKSDTSNIIYASAMKGAASGASDADARTGTLNGTGTINRRELDKETFQILSGGGTTSEATKVYDGTSAYDSGQSSFKMMTGVIVDDTVSSPAKETNLAAEKTGILKSEIDKIAFTVTTGKGEFRQGDRTTAAVDAAGANRAQYVAYNLTATNEDATKNWLGNYKLVDKTTSPATETNLSHGTTSDIIAKGTITKRALYVDLGKKTGIDKAYDAATGVNSPFNTWNDVNTTNAANGGAVYAGDSLTHAGNRLVSDGTSIKVTAEYDNKDVIRGANGDNVYTDKTGYETIKDDTHTVNYTVAVDGTKSYNYVLVDQSNIPSDLADKLASSATATNASVALAGKGKITPADLTVSFGHVTKEYDRTTDLKASDRNRQPILSGLQGGETITVATVGQPNGYGAAYSDANVADGKTVNYTNLSLGDTAKNYNIKTVTGETVGYSSDRTGSAFTPTTYDVTGKGDIKKATISYLRAETQAASKVYDGDTQVETASGSALLADVKGLITKVTVKNGDGTEFDASNDVVLRSAAYQDKNAGTGKSIDYKFDIINSSLYNNNPSTQTYTATNGTITKRAVTVDQIVNSDLTRAYMGAGEKGAYNTSGAAPVALSGDALVTFDTTNTTTVNDGANTYIAAAGDTGFIAGDTTTGGAAITNTTRGTYDTGNVKRDSARNVLTGQHTVTYDLSLSDMTNYEIVDSYATKNAITQKTGAGTITPRAVDATVGKVTKTYDAKVAAENIASAVSVAALFGDTATITGEYQADTAVSGDRAKDAGTNKDVNYTVDMGTSSDGYRINDNYDIRLNGSTVSYDSTGKATFTGKGDITKRDLKVQTSEDVAKTYDGTSNVASGQGTVSAVTNAADATGGLQLDDNGNQDVVTFAVADADKKYTGFTKSDGTVRSASDANANAADPDSTAMLWRVAYENVQAAGTDLKNYNLVGAATENNLQANADGTYKMTGKGRINRVALGDAALKMDIVDATKIYDGTANVKYTDNTSDVYKYMTNVRVDLGGGHEVALNSADLAAVVGTYDNGKNVASNATLPTGSATNVTYTITLGNNIGNDNYTIGTAGIVTRTGKGTITPRDVKATLQNDAFTKTYDGTTAVKVGGNDVSGDSLIALETQSGTRGWIDGTLTRTAAYDTKNVVRDASGNVLSTKTVTYTNTFDSADTAANYNITYVKSDGTTPVSFSTPSNVGGVITSVYTTGTVNTITPKDVTITAPSLADLTKTWDNTTVVRPSNSADGKLVVNGIEAVDTSTAVLNHPSAIGVDESASGKYTAAYDSVNAGSRTVTYSGVKLMGADAGNYNLASFAQTGTGGATGTLTANAAGAYDFAVNGAIAALPLDTNALKITLKDITKTYDGTTTLEHKTASGTETTDGEAWKNYISSIYLELNPSGSPSSKVYLSTSDIENVSAAYTDANAGTGKSVTYSFKLKDNANYSVTSSSGTGTNSFSGTLTANRPDTGVAGTSGIKTGAIDITKRNATVTIGDAVKIYDGTDAVKGNVNVSPAITDAKGLFTFQTQDNTNDTGWVTTDATPSSIRGAYGDKNAGANKGVSYTVNYGAKDLDNYNITYMNSAGNDVLPTSTTGTAVTVQTATNTIKQRQVGLNTKQGITKVYDGNTTVTGANAVLELEDEAGDTGVIAADKGKLTANAANKAYDSKNVLGTEGSTIHYTGVTLSGAEAGNYKLVNGSAAGNSNFTDNGAGTYTIDGTGTITPLTLTVNTGTGITKVYDGNTDVYINAGDANQLLKLAGIISGDSVSIASGYGAAYAEKNVKGIEGSTINYSNIALATGGDAANYTLAATTATGTGTITPRNLEVKLGKVTKTYDATTSVSNPDTYVTVEQATFGADGKPMGTSGWVETGAATVNGAFRTKDVSADATGNTVLSDKAVDWTLTHDALTNGNYTVTYKDSTNATLTGTTATAATTQNNMIDQKELDITFNRAVKKYDGTDDVLSASYVAINPTFTGLVGGETIQPTSAALDKIKGKYISSSYGEAAEDVARDDDGNVVDKSVTYTGISEALRALPDNPTGTATPQFKNTNYKIADTKTNQAGRIDPLNIKISDIKAEYDAVVREYQKGTGGYTTEIGDATAASSLHLKVEVPTAGGVKVWTSVAKEGVKAWFGNGAQDVTNSTANGDVGTGKTVTYTIGKITNFTLDDGAGNDPLAGMTEAEKFTYLNMDGANYRWQNSTGQTYATGSIKGDASTQAYDPAAATRQTNAITPRIIEVTAVGRNTKVYDGTKNVLDYTPDNLAFVSNPSGDSRGTVNAYGIFTADATGGTSFTTDGAEYADKDAGTKDVTYNLKLANGNGNYSVKYVDATGTTKTDTSTAGTDLSLAVLGTNTGVIEKRKVTVKLDQTTGLDKTYDGVNNVTAGNAIVVERNASAADDASKKTGILSGESASLDDNGAALAANGKYQQADTEGADGVYRTYNSATGYYDPSYKDATYDVSTLTLTENAGAAISHAKASNYEFVTDNTVDYDAVRTTGATKAADDASKTLRATGTINPKKITLQTKVDPTKVYDGTTNVIGTDTVTGIDYTTRYNITAGANRTDADILSDGAGSSPNTATKAGIRLSGTPQYNSKNVSEATTATYTLNQTNGNYDLYDVAGNKLSKWTSATAAQAKLDTHATITPKQLTWDANKVGYANKDYDGTTSVVNAVDNILAQTVGSVGTNHGNALVGVVDGDQVDVRGGLTVTGTYDNANAASSETPTSGVDKDGNAVTGADALLNHTVTYRISVDPTKMDATTAANYDFSVLTNPAGMQGKGSINRAELVVRPDSITIPMDSPVPAITGSVTGAVTGGDAVNQGDFTYALNDSSFSGTGLSGITMMGSNRVRPGYRQEGRLNKAGSAYDGKTSGNYGMNYRFHDAGGTLDVRLAPPNSEDKDAKQGLVGDRRFTPDDFAYYDASITDWKEKTYYRQPDALVDRENPSVKINGAISAEEALYATIPRGFGNYAGIAVIPVSADVQDAKPADRRASAPDGGVKLTLLIGGASDDDNALEEESEEEKILARRRAMISIQTEGLGVAL